MAGVPFIFGNATTSIPLTNLDANFNTGLTIGNTTVGLGNTVTTLGNVTLTNATVSSSSITDSGLTSGRVTVAGTGGLLTDSAGLTWNGTVLNAGATGSSTIIANGSTAGNGGAAFKMLGWASVAKNWEISAGVVGGFGLDFRPSTAAGGTTFTTSVLNIGETGTLLFNTSGSGVQFSNSSALTNSVLNDYETGTWTPAATNLTTISGTPTWSGIYTKIGNIVTVTFQLTNGNFTVTGGSTYVNNMPFASSYNGAGAFVLGSTVDGGILQSSSSSRCYFAATKTSTTFFCTVTYTATF